MMSKFIELHDASTGGEQFVNVGNIEGVFTEMVSEGIFVTHIDLTDGDCYQVRESYNELKQLIHDAGVLIHKPDPRLNLTKPLTMDNLREMIGEPVWNSNNNHWYLIDCIETNLDGSNERIILTNRGRVQMPYDADDLIKYPLYRMKQEVK